MGYSRALVHVWIAFIDLTKLLVPNSATHWCSIVQGVLQPLPRRGLSPFLLCLTWNISGGPPKQAFCQAKPETVKKKVRAYYDYSVIWCHSNGPSSMMSIDFFWSPESSRNNRNASGHQVVMTPVLPAQAVGKCRLPVVRALAYQAYKSMRKRQKHALKSATRQQPASQSFQATSGYTELDDRLIQAPGGIWQRCQGAGNENQRMSHRSSIRMYRFI